MPATAYVTGAKELSISPPFNPKFRSRVLRELRVWMPEPDAGRHRKDHRRSGREDGTLCLLLALLRNRKSIYWSLLSGANRTIFAHTEFFAF